MAKKHIADSTKPGYDWVYASGESAPVASYPELKKLLLRQLKLSEQDDDFFTPDYSETLHDPLLLGGVEAAVRRIDKALGRKEQIVVYGDYDIDGITATALLVDVLRQLGAQVRPYIPDRFEEGYGLNDEALLGLKKSGADLVITVDCGITSANEVAKAAQSGLEIIVTDHHTVPEATPDAAVACINPRLKNDSYPYKDLAGVAVAFKLAKALAAQHPDKIKPGREKWLLDLVALGTVCDVVPLNAENRALVQFGLKVLAKTPRVGLQALAEVSSVELKSIQTSDLGFRFGPRLNAAGRLEHASKALQLVITQDVEEAKRLAHDLNQLNRERQEETTRIFAEAMAQAEQFSSDSILVLSDPNWSHGIVGLVASRVSEAMHKPAIILQELSGKTKGSARSIGQFNIIQAVNACSDILERHGGHAFAAGMTLNTAQISEFRRRINLYAAEHKDDLSVGRELTVAAQLDVALLHKDLLALLDSFEPFGNGNSQPVLSAQLKLNRLRPVGADLSHLQFGFEAPGGVIGGISFGATTKWPWLKVGETVQVAFRASRNIWQGVESLQLEVVDVRPA